ncbi:MAG: hypothetical protein JNN01_17725 [Opitutaceae bacterium]|nr:hypothetical protein [Opitutaceae bacterium]
MKPPDSDAPFYVGYHARAPRELARTMRRTVALLGGLVIGAALLTAWALPVPGEGMFEFGRPRAISGIIRSQGAAPRLKNEDAEYLLVGLGKHRAPVELCSARGSEVELSGTLISGEGRRLLEVSSWRPTRKRSEPSLASGVSLGRVELIGEIVDSKCYFGVMNPGEGNLHRACAELCLRGGIPAVLVVKDRAGQVAHLLLTDPSGSELNPSLLAWAGAPLHIAGEVIREGDWLALRPELGSLRWFRR